MNPISVGPMGSTTDGNLKIAFITQWFPPEPTPIPLFIAQSLQRRGHDVDVLTGVPNYPTGVVTDGYKAWKPQSEIVEGVPVRRSPLYASHDKSATKRMLNYLSWAISTTLMCFNRLRIADVTLVFSSPATAALPAMVAKALARTPYVLYIQDLWPDTVTAAGFIENRRVGRMVSWALTKFTNCTYRFASHIIVLSPGMIPELESRGVDSSKMSLVYNWANETSPCDHPARDEALSRFGVDPKNFVVTYAGNHGAAQGLEVVVRAARRLHEETGIVFLFFGDGMERKKLERLSSELGCDNVQFIGAIPQAEMPYANAVTDLQLVSLIDNPLFEITMPSKVQGIFASATPLIAVAAGDAAEVVATSGAGWSVAPGDDANLAECVLEARALGPDGLKAMGAAGFDYYRANMGEAIGGERLDSILCDVVTR